VTSARLPKIPGEALDPPPKVFDAAQQVLDERHAAAGVLFRAWHRFVFARAPLLTAGTTYYLFLSLISLVAFGYGLVALIGADQLSVWLTDALNSAFPGLVGDEALSPEDLRSYGTTASIGGLLVMGLAGTSSVNAASQSLHILYGAPKDPRNIALRRTRMFGQLILLGLLILLSFIPSVLISTLAEPLRDTLGVDASVNPSLILVVTLCIALTLNFVVLWLLLSRHGGIRPSKRAIRIGAGAGAVVIETVKYSTAGIIAWSLDKPQYGAFAVPITVMLVLYLLSMSLYASAALTAAVALKERDELHEAAGRRGEAEAPGGSD